MLSEQPTNSATSSCVSPSRSRHSFGEIKSVMDHSLHAVNGKARKKFTLCALKEFSQCDSHLDMTSPQSRPTWIDPIIGRVARKLRESMGLSQEEAAHRMGLSKGLVSQLESGKKPWNSNTMAKACDLYGVTPVTLFSDTGEDIAAMFEKAPPHIKRTVSDFLKMKKD